MLIEQRVNGNDLRLVVIDGRVVAAALRLPPEVIGTGEHTLCDLIAGESRRRSAATGGESRIPLDAVTETTVGEYGWKLDGVLPQGMKLRVRHTANLHQGGTIHDVTPSVNQELCRIAVDLPRHRISVTGIDLLVPDVTGQEYAFIEANERPGLANHEPQPTAAAFVDYLFPGQPGQPFAWTPEESPRNPDDRSSGKRYRVRTACRSGQRRSARRCSRWRRYGCSRSWRRRLGSGQTRYARSRSCTRPRAR